MSALAVPCRHVSYRDALEFSAKLAIARDLPLIKAQPSVYLPYASICRSATSRTGRHKLVVNLQ